MKVFHIYSSPFTSTSVRTQKHLLKNGDGHFTFLLLYLKYNIFILYNIVVAEYLLEWCFLLRQFLLDVVMFCTQTPCKRNSWLCISVAATELIGHFTDGLLPYSFTWRTHVSLLSLFTWFETINLPGCWHCMYLYGISDMDKGQPKTRQF